MVRAGPLGIARCPRRRTKELVCRTQGHPRVRIVRGTVRAVLACASARTVPCGGNLCSRQSTLAESLRGWCPQGRGGSSPLFRTNAVRSQMSRISFTGSPTSFPNTNAAGGCWAPSGPDFRSSRTDPSPTSATQGTNTAAVRDFSHWAAERSGFPPVSVARATARRARAWHTACPLVDVPLPEGTDAVRMIASTLGVLAAVVGAAVLYGASRWRKQTERLHEDFTRGSPADGAFDI